MLSQTEIILEGVGYVSALSSLLITKVKTV